MGRKRVDYVVGEVTVGDENHFPILRLHAFTILPLCFLIGTLSWSGS